MQALFTHHVFVDLETTGLDPGVDEVVELGALFVEQGRVVKRLDRLFSSRAPLPLTIRRITGLSDEDLQGRGAFSDYEGELRRELEGWTVVAHNAPFEQSFLGGLLQDIGAPVLDSCELLHYLYPELESHSLEALVSWAGVSDRAAHRALRDCEDTLAVVSRALERCVEEGRGDDVRDALSCLRCDDPALLPMLAVLEGLEAGCRLRPPPLELTGSTPFLPAPPGRARSGERALAAADGATPAIGAEELEAVLGPGGALERTVPGFQHRPQQVAIANDVARTLAEGGRLAVEAGTGTGKSLAYLTPAALFAARSGRKVAVAPHTKALQDQLIEKDLPKLHRATGGAFQFSVLKGQQNYLCRRRALELCRVDAAMGHEQRAARAYLRALLRRSPDGDIDRASHWFRERFTALNGLLLAARSESATTLGPRCPHYRQCFYHSAVAQAHEADVLVVNQSLALQWSQRLPEVKEFILDEAHEVEDAATAALGMELTDGALQMVAERVLGRGSRAGIARALGLTVATASDRARAKELAETARARAKGMLEASAEIAQAVPALERGKGADAVDGRRLDEAARASPAFEALYERLVTLRLELEALERLLAVEVREAFPSFGELDPGLERELSGAQVEIAGLRQFLEELCDSPRASRCYAAASAMRGDRRGFTLSAQPIDVRTPFLEEFAEDKRALVLTSATLFTGSGRPWVLQRLGLEAPSLRVVRARTPFELERQALVVLVTDAPEVQGDAFLDWAAGRISGLAEFLGGRVLGLFASTRRLEEVSDRVRARLEPEGIEVLTQSRGNARSLAAKQERDFGSVLLGTKSFWQGVDIPGNGVGVVFIDKLPIEPQGRPLVAAREERFGDAPFAGFAHYRLPRALLLLRQGVGRLIRSTTDRGVVIVADPGNAAYRDQVRAALEGYRVEELPWAVARRRVRDALVQMGLVRGDTSSRTSSPTLQVPSP
jgi:ATP-dependent DNA helicase DinG